MKSTATLPIILALAIIFAFCPSTAFANASNMSEADQPDADGMEALAAASEIDVLVPGMATMMASPVIVTAADLVTKVYGAIDLPSAGEEAYSRAQTIIKAGKTLKVRPTVDETGIWMDNESGYAVNYSGMTPKVSAVAQFDNDALSSFGYFFLFPYASGCRDEANRNQCAFCASLLQEMYDMGSIVGVPADEETDEADRLFTALGSYEGNHINVTLREQTAPDASGRFLLVLEVTPNAYNLYDGVMAMGNGK